MRPSGWLQLKYCPNAEPSFCSEPVLNRSRPSWTGARVENEDSARLRNADPSTGTEKWLSLTDFPSLFMKALCCLSNIFRQWGVFSNGEESINILKIWVPLQVWIYFVTSVSDPYLSNPDPNPARNLNPDPDPERPWICFTYTKVN